MATIILVCLAIGYVIVGVGAFLIALITGDVGTAFLSLFIAPVLFFPATGIIAVIAFLVMKAKYELRGR
jgi:hypothetical protein